MKNQRHFPDERRVLSKVHKCKIYGMCRGLERSMWVDYSMCACVCARM